MTADQSVSLQSQVVFNSDGLVPVIAQQYDTGEVLMLAWMNSEALRRTIDTGRATYWSRSRGEYWRKGDTSGHTQSVRAVRLDCDGDALLLEVDQVGPACHNGLRSCFDTLVVQLTPSPSQQAGGHK
ncbi:MAG: phosphoribosyl-AMP cyclohydrolase [Actinomycetes bacterium]